MDDTKTAHALLNDEPEASESSLPVGLLDELRTLSGAYDQLATRSRQLFEQIRKMLGQDRLIDCLEGIQILAERGEPAGARLLAALLDANTPGSQLLPHVQRFSSVSRLLVLDPELVGASFLNEWKQRLEELVVACRERCGASAPVEPAHPNLVFPHHRHPIPLLRHAVDQLLPQSATDVITSADMDLLAGLVRLECDAYQERVSRLAGTVDPYRVTAVMRTLPLLSRADSEIRDLIQMAIQLEGGDLESVFKKRIPRQFEVLEDGERPRFAAILRGETRLQRMAAMHAAFLANPPSMSQLAGPVACLLLLGRELHRIGARERELGLVTAVEMALVHRDGERWAMPLPDGLAEKVGQLLATKSSTETGLLAGCGVVAGELVLAEAPITLGERLWRHDLPTLAEMEVTGDPDTSDQVDEGEDQATRRDDQESTSAVKQTVMNNIGSVSILLGFLRNAKVTGIPGLVADVARRTRSGRVLEVIAGDRKLHSGHANKDVPRALLESPVNVSVKLLRRFVHVKYVTKTDLRRMARDKARLRKEVCREIELYLESLG